MKKYQLNRVHEYDNAKSALTFDALWFENTTIKKVFFKHHGTMNKIITILQYKENLKCLGRSNFSISVSFTVVVGRPLGHVFFSTFPGRDDFLCN